MIGRETIETNQYLSLEHLSRLMRNQWNIAEYNDFFIGKPTKASIEEYIILPATERFCIIVFTREAKGLFNKVNKVVLSVADSNSGIKDRLLASVPSGNVFFGIWKIARNMSIEEERKGPSQQVLEKYREYLEKLLKENGYC